MANNPKEVIEIVPDNLDTLHGINITVKNCKHPETAKQKFLTSPNRSSRLYQLNVENSDLRGSFQDTHFDLSVLESIKLTNSQFNASELLNILEKSWQGLHIKLTSEDIKNCKIHGTNEEMIALEKKLGFKLSDATFVSTSSNSSPTPGFNISRGNTTPEQDNSTKARLQAIPAMIEIQRRMQRVLINYNSLPQVKKDPNLICTQIESPAKDAHILQKGAEPLLTGTLGGTQVHKAFLDSPIDVADKAKLILLSLGLPTTDLTETLPAELTFQPPNLHDPVQNAVRAQYVTIKRDFDNEKSAGPSAPSDVFQVTL